MEPDQQQPSEARKPDPPQRSYECHFCKRGFTNAQALGGHMNIHRKDKNKSKHSSSSSTATTLNPLIEPLSHTRSQPTPASTTTASANPFLVSGHQGSWFPVTTQDEKKPLPLFDHQDTAVPRLIIPQPGSPPLPDADVDLELRLGHVEPQQDQSSSENKTTTTRKFF